MTEDEKDDLYMKHDLAKKIGGFRMALDIFDKYLEKKSYFLGAEHDELHIWVDTDKLPEDSEEGRLLISLGWHVNEYDNWSYFT